MEIECDVLVVGCGPVGAAAARASALSGAKTLVVDRKKTIGEPVACGEAIGACYLARLPFKIPRDQLMLKLDGIRLIYGNKSADRTGGVWPGYAIDRARFDRFLAQQAMRAGAKLMASAELSSISKRRGKIASARISFSGREMDVIPRAVVAADGVNSGVAEKMGLLKRRKGGTGEIHSWEMHGVRLDSLAFDQIFIGDFVDAGYGYIFPKSPGVANVGVGSILPKREMGEYFRRFLAHPRVKTQVSGAKMIREKSKTAPFGDSSVPFASGNALFAGDSANQNIKPFVEGILPGVICGDLAGKSAAGNALRNEPLSGYEKSALEALPELGFSRHLAKTMLKAFRLEPARQCAILYLLTAEIVGIEDAEALLQKSAKELRSLVERG